MILLTLDCECEGEFPDDYCLELELFIGDACNDNNPNTFQDVVNENCICEGELPVPVFCISGGTVVNPVMNPVTGDIWMDRNLGASQVATSLNDVDSYGDLYQWGRFSDGHQCRFSEITYDLSSSNYPGHDDFIVDVDAGDWRTTPNNGLWQGLSGLNNPCPEQYRLPTLAELESERLSWNSNNLNGAFNSPLKIPAAGYRQAQTGQLDQVDELAAFWTSTVSDNEGGLITVASWATFTGYVGKANGNSIRCIGVDIEIPYDCPELEANVGDSCNDGNPITFDDALNEDCDCEGVFPSNWCQNLSLFIGDPCNDGNPITINDEVDQNCECNGEIPSNFCVELALFMGDSCDDGNSSTNNDSVNSNCECAGDTFPENTVHCIVGGTEVVALTNPATGVTWMDRNLGASQVATSKYDQASFGDLYQWGRFSDGHQCRDSELFFNLSSSDQPNTDRFIVSTENPEDWRNPQNDNLWQGINGVNNPCPSGFRIPTMAEWENEVSSWSSENSNGAFNSALKLPTSGSRDTNGEILESDPPVALYWSSTIFNTRSRSLLFLDFNLIEGNSFRARGNAVRCIQD